MPFEASEFVRNGKYTDIQHLALGAYGRVCSARDRLGRLVAVKELAPGALSPQRYAEFCERFQREFKLQHSFRDNHIIYVIDLEKDSQTGEWYSICELADKKSLADYLNVHGTLSEEDALSVGLDICAALEKTWSLRIVHRDVKPGNILLCTAPNRTFPLAKLGDFGSAYEPKQTILANKPVDVHITPDYAPPQFVPGNPLFNPSTINDPYFVPDITFDIYSLGITLWEILTREDFKDLARVGLPSLQQYAPNASPGIARVIGWALEDEPSKRYQLPEDLKADLERVRDGQAPVGPNARLVVSPAVSATPPKPKSFSIPRNLFASIAILLIAGAGFFIFRSFGSDRLPTLVAISTAAIVAVAPTTTNTILPTLTPTPAPLTATPEPPTATFEPLTTTPVPPTATSEQLTATPEPPTATPIPPTATPEPPTATPESSIITITFSADDTASIDPSNPTVEVDGIQLTITRAQLIDGKIRFQMQAVNTGSGNVILRRDAFRVNDDTGEVYKAGDPSSWDEEFLTSLTGYITLDRPLSATASKVTIAFIGVWNRPGHPGLYLRSINIRLPPNYSDHSTGASQPTGQPVALDPSNPTVEVDGIQLTITRAQLIDGKIRFQMQAVNTGSGNVILRRDAFRVNDDTGEVYKAGDPSSWDEEFLTSLTGYITLDRPLSATASKVTIAFIGVWNRPGHPGLYIKDVRITS